MKKLTLRGQEVAELLGVSHVTVKRHAVTGKIPSVLIGGIRLYNREQIELLTHDEDWEDRWKGFCQQK